MNGHARSYADEVRRRSLQDHEGRNASTSLLGFTMVAPRLAVVLVWLLTDWFAVAFASMLWPLTAGLVLPTTLLWSSAVHQWFQGRWTLLAVVGLMAAIVIDLGAIREFLRIRRQRPGTP